jgi:hypothetical protein
MDLIKHYQEKNRNIVEENSTLFKASQINEELSPFSESIQLNKNIMNKQNIILDLVSIPNSMINCFKNGCLDLYIEYYNYVKSLDEREYATSSRKENNIISLIKRNVEKLNNLVKVLIGKMLLHGGTMSLNLCPSEQNDFKLEEIFVILELESFAKEIFNFSEFNDVVKKITVILHAMNLYFINYQSLSLNTSNIPVHLENKNILKLFEYCKEKFSFISFICGNESYSECLNSSKFFILEKLILPVVRENYFDSSKGEESQRVEESYSKSNSLFSFKDKKDNLINFLNEINSYSYKEENSNVNFSLSKIKEIINENFFLYLDRVLVFNQNSVCRYLSRTKDFKKLTACENQIRNEFITILQFNFLEILNEITCQEFNSIKEKFRLFSMIEKSTDKILNSIQNFFNDNFYLIKINSEIEYNKDNSQPETPLKNFKLLLIDIEKEKGIILEFIKNIYDCQGLIKFWEKKFLPSKKEEWMKFLAEE